MKARLDKVVVVEMTPEEALEFWRTYHPRPDSIGKKLDAAIRGALDEHEGVESA